jgi:TRAP-type C4-dicarboxylate transport system substrate-binding protein
MKAHRISILILVLFAILIASPWNEVLGQRFGGHEGKGFWPDMNQEQRAAVQDMIKEMKEQGATREEIRTAVADMLKGYGIEVPENWPGPFGFGHNRGGFWKDLTEEQREAIHEKIKEMREEDATREEIRIAVAEMLEGYGIEVPENWPGPFGPGHGRGGFWKDLTEEQREAVQERIKELREEGATREEIHTAVAEMLKGYGIELPEKRGEGHRGDLRQLLSGLTDEQRQAVREKIREMRRQGSTREEIRAAVAEMLEGFGIELPKDSEEGSSEISPAKPQIQAQNYPNPFNPQTEIAYNLPVDSKVKLTILNIQGQKVKVLVDEYQNAGAKKVTWDGCDENGERVASGVYFYLIKAGPYTASNQMVLLK